MSGRGDLRGAIWQRLRQRVLATEDACGICGRPVDKSVRYPDPWSAAVDHVVPVSRGGDPWDRRNLQLAHRVCNQVKYTGPRTRRRGTSVAASRDWLG